MWIATRSRDRRATTTLAKRLSDLGFSLIAAGATAGALVIDIPEDGRARNGAAVFRQTALRHNIPYYTTVDGAQALIGAIEVMLKGELEALTLQEHHRPASPGAAATAA